LSIKGPHWCGQEKQQKIREKISKKKKKKRELPASLFFKSIAKIARVWRTRAGPSSSV